MPRIRRGRAKTFQRGERLRASCESAVGFRRPTRGPRRIRPGGQPMKFRITLAASAAVLLGGAASANASNTLTTTVEGPQGVVWTGQCPEWVAESDIDKVSSMCRNLGFRLPTDTLRTVRSLGGTKITD